MLTLALHLLSRIGTALIVVLAIPNGGTAGQVVAVPRVVIYPGSIIAEGILEERLMQSGDHRGGAWYATRSSLVGKIARRTLLPGRPIALGDVKEPDLVQSGKTVVLKFSMQGLQIIGQGIALQGGVGGSQIAVRNSESGTVVRGTIAEDGSVSVGD